MAFKEGDDALENEDDDFQNVKRLKASMEEYRNVPLPLNEFFTAGHSQKNNNSILKGELSNEDLNNFYDYPEEKQNSENFIIQEDEKNLSSYEILGYLDENKETLKRLSFMENKVRCKNMNIHPRGYYQTYSFRPSWCQNGFVSGGNNRNGVFEVNINKLIVFQDLYKSSSDPSTNYENYEKSLEIYNKNLAILFKTISEKNDMESVETNIKSLSFQEQNENNKNFQKYIWPEKEEFMKRVLLYMNKYVKTLNSQQNNQFQNIVKENFFKGEFFDLILINILFGNPNIDLLRYFKLQNIELHENFQSILESFDKKRANNQNLSDYLRKKLLNKWIEAKAEKVSY